MSQAEDLKRRAAARALEQVRPHSVVGLGTGTTMAHFLELMAEAVAQGRLPGVRGVPTSTATRTRALELDIPLTTLEEDPDLDLAVDGADEVDPHGRLIKGMGGALLREKIVAHAAGGLVVIVDEGKLVPRLGTRSPLPVEVVPFGWTLHAREAQALGGRPEVRRDRSGEPVRTDNGHVLLDVTFPDGIEDPEHVDAVLSGRPGVVETGFFFSLTREVLVSGGSGVRSMELTPLRGGA